MKALYISDNNVVINDKTTSIKDLDGFYITESTKEEIEQTLINKGYTRNIQEQSKTRNNEYFIKKNGFIKVKVGRKQVTIVNKKDYCLKSTKFNLEDFVKELNNLGINNNIGKYCIDKEREFINKKIGDLYYYKFVDEMSRGILKDEESREIYTNLANNNGGGLCICSQYGMFKDIYCYDFHSMYPSIARNYELPFGIPTLLEDCDGLVKYKGHVGFYKVTFNGDYFNDDLIRFEDGWYFENEIERALELGYDINFEKVCFWKLEKGYFDEWVDWLWDLKNNGNPIQKVIAKQGLNTTLGKLSQGARDFKEKSYRQYEFRSLVTQRYITAIGRMNISKIAQYIIDNYGSDAYLYTDTDSIHTTLTPNEFEKVCNELGFIYGEELGNISLEKSMEKVIYSSKKHYTYIDKETKEVMFVASGITSKERKEKLYEEIKGGAECKEEDLILANSTKELTFPNLKQISLLLEEVTQEVNLPNHRQLTPALLNFTMNVRD